MKRGATLVSKLSPLFLAALFSTVCSANIQAAPVTYTETATISGSLAGTGFTDDLITLAGSGDTSGIDNSTPMIFRLVLGVTFSLSGLGTSGTFTNPTQVASNQIFDDAGFGDRTLNRAILFTHNIAFATYDLSTSIGPITGSPGTINAGLAFPTSVGDLIINSSGDVTFTAVVSATTPLPGAFALFASGATVLGFFGWCRKKKTAALAA